ncbi:metallo-beta-lactamase [Porphyromonas macacae]|uniref:MBL fold metallo-hydrolase n=1 Tax=Porphyromonas macacae TaxID=28115 RepID=UPI00052C9175|nr:MBL fold metallo-hydrolase [Porphyromonas macacae]KGN99455.1 metallo-beta-lactamase [Porphyromonas macacae]
MSLSSGSSGNCYYLGNDEQGILIDAGIPIRTITKTLKKEGIAPDGSHIRGVIVTHDHADHIRTVGVLGCVHHMQIYGTKKVLDGIERSRFVNDSLFGHRNEIVCGKTFNLGGFEITPFPVPHDASENVGYHITAPGFRFTLITDAGHVTPEIKHYASLAEHLVIEANHDVEMLRDGIYPQFLKDRVAGPNGHLSNQTTAELLAEIYHPGMKNIWLCHLSKDNNHPELCWKTIEYRLFCEGIRVGKDISLTALRRTSSSPLYLLEP